MASQKTSQINVVALVEEGVRLIAQGNHLLTKAQVLCEHKEAAVVDGVMICGLCGARKLL